MGILNVTPDSFSDGDCYLSIESAVARAEQMLDQGAHIIDVGGESTRPGAVEVPDHLQIERVVPVIETLVARRPHVTISVDTRLANVAEAALIAGASLVNDVSALRDDPAMVGLVKRSSAAVILMHRRGIPLTMQQGGGPQYDDVVAEVTQFLEERTSFAESSGVDPSHIILDPGLGFGKRIEHNILLLRHLKTIVAIGKPVLVGASRKAFLTAIAGCDSLNNLKSEGAWPIARDRPQDRLAGSLACAVWAAHQGASIVRVHDVYETIRALNAWAAISRCD